MWHNIWHIASKPDNIPIVIMLFLVLFFGWLSFSLAFKNDRIRAEAARRRKEEEGEGEGEKKAKGDVVDVIDIMYPEEEQGLPRKVSCWPHLVKLEFICAILVMALLIIWSVPIDAPLEEPANAALTPNPSKAPWYFLGLQDMLVYFDPYIAGVILPSFIIFGLILVPYVDVNPKGNGYYTFSERRFAILTYWFGFFFLWVVEIVIGVFCRGPGWMFFVPGQRWDPHRVVAEVNINLNEFLANMTGMAELKSYEAGLIIGLGAILGYYAIGTLLPYIWLKRSNSETLEKLGFIRYSIVCFFFWTMMALPIKMVMRLFFSIKYILVTPWLNV
ncbi:MAG: cytochrome C [Candidatus Brocadiales bacterium]